LPAPHFHIDERREGESTRLTLTGELDLASVEMLKNRLAQLEERRQAVRLDLSQLEFIDSVGLHLLLKTVQNARTRDWPFAIDPSLAPPVKTMFELIQLEDFLLDQSSDRG
jgi:anti-anti-sigma factor